MDAKIAKSTRISKYRKGERGAALVTVMMISFLLLLASIALILESSMQSVNVTDAVSEEQAYYAAESGIQSVVDAMRHNAVPNPLVDPAATPLPSGEPAVINRLDYRKAVDRRYSNASCDPEAAADSLCDDPRDDDAARLSRWIDYSWGPTGGTADTSPDRVVLGDPATYSPMNGFAFSVEVSDPDNTAGTVTFSVDPNKSGIEQGDSTYLPSRTFPDGGINPDPDKFTTVRYIPPLVQPTPLDVSSGSGIADIGSFRYTNGDNGAGIIPSGDELVRFRITLAFTEPANGRIVIRGYILPPGPPDLHSNEDPDGLCERPTLSYLFDSQNFLSFRSRQTIVDDPASPGCLVEEIPPTSNGPYETYLTGWQVQPAAPGADRRIDLQITQPEPRRILIRSTGYGPRGAKKQLESVIQKNYFDGMGAPSPLTLIGPTCTRQGPTDVTCTQTNAIPAGVPGIVNGLTPESQFIFKPGTSNPIEYSGRDAALTVFQPPIGVTNNVNLNAVRYTIANDFGGKIFGAPENVAEDLPFWLQNPANIERTIQLLREVAQASGSYYGFNTPPPNNAVFGDWTTGRGITVIDTDGGAKLNHKAGGLLVVTSGGLALQGKYDFRGVMLITGPDGLYRAGGGGGQCSPGTTCGRLQGNMIIAPYIPWSLNTCMPDTTTPQFQDKLNCFLSPKYDISGGGNSELMGNEQDVATALNGLGNFVKGVAEK